MRETHTMSSTTIHALENLERIQDDLDPRAAHIIKVLIQAELPCREYDSAAYLEKLADAVHNLWNHLCQLDTQNLEAWDIGVLELASLYGAANGMRTFPRKEDDTEKVSTCGTCGQKVRDLEDRVDIEWYSDTECGPCGRERITGGE